jgi:sugar lactone lactonase YvrE
VGAGARFNTPRSITTDGTNLFVNDLGNKTIRRIVIATGAVTTLAGSAGTLPDLVDGTGTAAKFHNPAGITMDGTNLYVVESDKKAVRRIVIATGVVTTPVTAAEGLWWPVGITTNGPALFVTDVSRVVKFSVASNDTTAPTVTGATASVLTNSLSIPVTITAADNAGGSGVAAYLVTASAAVPAASAAGWNTTNPFVYTVAGNGTYTLYAWAKDGSGNVSATPAATMPITVNTAGPPSVVLMGGSLQGNALNPTPSSITLTTLAGGTTGSTDGTGAAAAFHNPNGITTDGTHLFVADTYSHTIRKVVIATAEVSTLAGMPDVSGSADGTGSNARFNWPFDVTTDGTHLFVVDGQNSTIRRIVIATGVVTTLAGSAADPAGSVDGIGAAARFASPCGITTDGTYLYVADTYSHTIRRVVIATAEVTTLAGTAYSAGSTNGVGAGARFNTPRSITTDGTNLYVNDLGNKTIRKIVIATGAVTTLAGSAGTDPDLVDGTGTAAKFHNPSGVTTDGTNLYVVESDKKAVRKVVIATGAVTTPMALASVLWWPTGITTDGDSLYVADIYCIREISIAPTPAAAATTAAKSSGGGGGGCFIATAAYGSYLDPHVLVLRHFRDHYLLPHGPGRAFVSLYYAASPPIADVIRRYGPLRSLTRFLLTPVVYAVAYPWLLPRLAGLAAGVVFLRKRRHAALRGGI